MVVMTSNALRNKDLKKNKIFPEEEMERYVIAGESLK
jgi:hypothetical protein